MDEQEKDELRHQGTRCVSRTDSHAQRRAFPRQPLDPSCRLRLTDDDRRRRLAARGVLLGRKLVAQVATIVTPETILAWHRKLVGKAMTCGRRSPGRPQKSRDLATLVVKMAKDNPTWGYDRIQGALKNVGHIVAPTTIRNILRRRGLEPAPLRKPKTAWKTFLKAHWSSPAAADFFTTEIWSRAVW